MVKTNLRFTSFPYLFLIFYYIFQYLWRKLNKPMRYFYTSLLCFFVFIHTLIAQSTQDFKNRYNYAKNLINENRFDLAQEALKQVLERHPNNVYYEYAHFYSAYIAFQQKDYQKSAVILKQLSTSTGNLKKNDEIYYLLANSQFLLDNLLDANANTQKILSPTLRKEAAQMQANFVAKSNNIKELKQILATYPNDENVGLRLLQILQAQKDIATTDKALLADLTKKYASKVEIVQSVINTTVIERDNKKPIDVALMLPMLVKETDASKPVRKNQFVIDYYYGLLVAQEKLKEEGIETNLFFYDTEKDETKIKQILANSTLQNTDLIIGPMFPKDTPPVLKYAQDNNICLVNPLTNNAESIKSYANAYLTEPSSETMGRKAAEYAYKNFSDSTIIYFGNQRQDSILATSFMNRFIELGGKAPIFKNMASFRNAFKSVTADLAPYAGKPTKIFAFVAAADQTLAINLLSGVQSQNLALQILTTQDWLDFTQTTYEQLEQAKVHFIFSSYLDYYMPNVRLFDAKYIDKSNMIPSRFSYSGHDALYYFAKMIKKYGKNLQQGIAENAAIDGLLLQGFDYTKGNDNQKMLKGQFINGKLEVVSLE